MEHRRKLIEKIRSVGPPAPGKPFPVVSLEDFFVGNEDDGSIACNLTEHPGPQAFFERLKEIRKKQNVQDVLVEISEVEELHAEMWPFSDRIYILTSASREEVAGWVSRLMPDEVEEGFAHGLPPDSAPVLKEGMKAYGVWWD